LEAGFLAAFLGSAQTPPPTLVIWLMRWLLLRVELGAGLIKLRGDPCWRNLTCLYYHHETQPMPNPLSWFFHHLPKRLHRLEVLANHFAQLVVPVALFAPQPISGIAGAIIVFTQLWLILSGNFSWLNFVTVTLAVAAFDDAQLGRVVRVAPPSLLAPARWHQATVIGLAFTVGVLSYWPIRNLASRRQRMNYSFDPFRLVNTYGAFGSITKVRYEVIVEGTNAAALGSTTTWKEYEFKGKPGDPKRRPRQFAPYHLRLDWLMWFAAMSPAIDHRWFVQLMEKLLQNDHPTLKLLRKNPFPEKAPTFVRATLYRYRFTTPKERRETGCWWVRTLVDEYLPPVCLDADHVLRMASPR
jgi:hypothetical protein